MTVDGAVSDHGAAGAGPARAATLPRVPAIWFEVEDLIRHFDMSGTPSGIQRVGHEILKEAERMHGAQGRVRFCRLSLFTSQIEPIELATAQNAMTAPIARYGPMRPILPPGSLATKLKALVPGLLRRGRWMASFPVQLVRDAWAARGGRLQFERLVAPQDVIVCLGIPCFNRRHNRSMARLKQRHGVRFAVLIHDIIPISEKAIANPHAAMRFEPWLREVLSTADLLFTVSDFTRRELLAYAQKNGMKTPPIEVLRMGTGFSERPDVRTGAFDLPEDFVLYVSTIEARKNHILLLRLWRELLKRHPVETVPTLLFVGTIGWLVDEFLAELKASHHLDGKIRIVSGLSDAALREAYRRCRFTVFPSLSEGWGLPVAESLAQGKFCIASNRASLPEVGGDFVDYIDPADETGALETMERAICEPGYLVRREAEIKARYRPASWADCTNDMIAKLDSL